MNVASRPIIVPHLVVPHSSSVPHYSSTNAPTMPWDNQDPSYWDVDVLRPIIIVIAVVVMLVIVLRK